MIISGSFGPVSSISSNTVPWTVQPTSSWYRSLSSEISDSRRPNLIRRRRRLRFFFPVGAAYGRPFGFFGGGLRLAGGFPLPFGAGLFPGGAGRLPLEGGLLPFGGGGAPPFFGGGGAFLFAGGGPGGGGAFLFFGGAGGAPPFFGGGGGGADFSAMIIHLWQSR